MLEFFKDKSLVVGVRTDLLVLLASAGVTIDDAVGQAYDRIRKAYGSDLTDADISSSPYCHEIAPFITKTLLRQAAIGGTGLRAYVEVHALDQNWRMAHCYTALGRSDERLSTYVVVDATYKQFMHGHIASSMPNVFVGSRQEMIDRMQRDAYDPSAYRLYEPGTLQLATTRSLASDMNLPVAPRHL